MNMTQTDLPKIAFGIALTTSSLLAQDVFQLRVPGPGEPNGPQTVTFQGADRTRNAAFGYVRSEIGSAEVVKNAPYSAEAVSETVQLLQDGNRIVHKDNTVLARDSEGRTRRDVSLPALPAMAQGDAPRFSMIFDAPTGTSWTLDHNAKVARKAQGQTFMIQSRTQAEPATAGVAMAGKSAIKIEHRAAFTAAMPVLAVAGGQENSKTESLGRQTMEGVAVDGSRTTTTIAAGEIGNERPIEIVSERWYSPELQTLIYSKHTDPRMGETTYKLTNVRKGEPAKSLFEVPSDYSVQTADEQMMKKVAEQELLKQK